VVGVSLSSNCTNSGTRWMHHVVASMYHCKYFCCIFKCSYVWKNSTATSM